MPRVTAKTRHATATVKSGGEDKFPIPDKNHARMALAMLNRAKPPLTPGQKAKVEDVADRKLGIRQGSARDKRRDRKAGDRS